MKTIRAMAIAATLLMPGMAVAQGARGQQNPNREATEQRVRERMTAMIKTRLGLNDEQMKKLAETNSRFDERRRLLRDQERDIRMSMRDEMMLGDKANQAKVGEMLDRMLKVQRQRLDILEQEQKEMSAYLTPVQRVRFHALQDQMRQFRDQVQRRRGKGGGPRGRDGAGAPRRPGGPPGF